MAVEETMQPEEKPQWQVDLDQVGFVRRLFLARKWYGGDWWFVVVSAILLLFVIILGVFPQWFAPYDPREEVGPSLLAPGAPPAGYVLVVQTATQIESLRVVWPGGGEQAVSVRGVDTTVVVEQGAEAVRD